MNHHVHILLLFGDIMLIGFIKSLKKQHRENR